MVVFFVRGYFFVFRWSDRVSYFVRHLESALSVVVCGLLLMVAQFLVAINFFLLPLSLLPVVCNITFASFCFFSALWRCVMISLSTLTFF